MTAVVPYLPPKHIAVVNVSSIADDREVAFWVEACARQLTDVAAAWGFAAPGIALYSRDVEVPRREGSIVAVADNDFDPETAGYHSPWGAIVDMSQAAVPSRTFSHEVIEMAGNLMLDRWAAGPRRRRYALELCDPVQRHGYGIPVDLFGIRSEVPVSNWVLPAWFTLESAGPYDWLGYLDQPFSLLEGGYAIAQEQDGELLMLAHRDGASFGASKFRKSRTRRIIAGLR